MFMNLFYFNLIRICSLLLLFDMNKRLVFISYRFYRLASFYLSKRKDGPSHDV